MNVSLRQFLQACKEHDWTYEMSDTPSVWDRGRRQRARLHDVLRANPDFRPFYNTMKNAAWNHHTTFTSMPTASKEDFERAGVAEYYPPDGK